MLRCNHMLSSLMRNSNLHYPPTIYETNFRRVAPSVLCYSSLNVVESQQLLPGKGLINGEWVDAENGATFEVTDPGNGDVLCKLPCMYSEDCARGIEAATSAFKSWKRTPATQRANVMRKWYNLLMDNKQDIIKIITLEAGKPLYEASAEFDVGMSFMDWDINESVRLHGSIIPNIRNNVTAHTIREPIGPVAAITPWNFPFSMVTRKVTPAIAAGCTVLLKPSELTPLTSLLFGQLALEAGLPPGVFNIVMGDDKSIGSCMLSNPAIRLLSFTGSTSVGKYLYSEASRTVKRVHLELGGNAPFIVCSDADVDLAAQSVLMSGLRNAGQACISANRVLVQKGVHDEFVDKVLERIKKVKVGHGMVEGVKMGPLINDQGLNKVKTHVADALDKGATLHYGGKAPDDVSAAGFFYMPTVLTGIEKSMHVYTSETFGPLVSIMQFDDVDEAIALGNDTEYGLAAYAFSKDIKQAWHIANNLEYGMVGVNDVAFSCLQTPFGGVKQSGIGRELGQYGISEFLEDRAIYMGMH